ncbi:MAG: hypothetical protein LC105_10420 [Chitinophagales bacterium]|nr:hypothetical protein [Chitinophagales bacterium]MCZ2394262.1 hypothetical protein [Chitinophagales bacterium]
MQELLRGKRILVAILNWGLGHATRMTPVIEQLIDRGAEVSLAGDGASLVFLSEVFPKLPKFELPPYNIEYPSGWGGAWKTVFKAPKIIQAIKDEQIAIADIVERYQIEAIISDNRYGVFSAKIPSIFVGHQLRVLPPKGFQWGSALILAWHKKYLKNFSEIWVPDFDDERNFSGRLSHDVDTGIPIKYMGPQSRFAHYFSKESTEGENIVVVLSGPEPQRTFLEGKILEQLKNYQRPSVLVRGVVHEKEERQIGNVKTINYLHGERLIQVLLSAHCVICRSGYSSIMDLALLGKKVIFIPTPGQTEQIYLAERLAEKKWAIHQSQSRLNLPEAISSLEKIQPFYQSGWDTHLLEDRLKELRDSIDKIKV